MDAEAASHYLDNNAQNIPVRNDSNNSQNNFWNDIQNGDYWFNMQDALQGNYQGIILPNNLLDMIEDEFGSFDNINIIDNIDDSSYNGPEVRMY